MDQAVVSSKISETSSESGMCGSALGTVIVSVLRIGAGGAEDAGGAGRLGWWEKGGGEGRRRGDLRCGKDGSICVLGPGVRGGEGRGLLIRLRPAGRLAFGLESRGRGEKESGRAGGMLEGSRGEERETTWLNSRIYHDASSESCSSSASGSISGEKGASVNSKISTGLASGFERDGVERVTASGWKDICGEVMVLLGGWEHNRSSSDVPGVVGTSVLEQADMLVREGVGERARCED
jgi:hypothetical protein